MRLRPEFEQLEQKRRLATDTVDIAQAMRWLQGDDFGHPASKADVFAVIGSSGGSNKHRIADLVSALSAGQVRSWAATARMPARSLRRFGLLEPDQVHMEHTYSLIDIPVPAEAWQSNGASTLGANRMEYEGATLIDFRFSKADMASVYPASAKAREPIAAKKQTRPPGVRPFDESDIKAVVQAELNREWDEQDRQFTSIEASLRDVISSVGRMRRTTDDDSVVRRLMRRRRQLVKEGRLQELVAAEKARQANALGR